MQSVMFLQQKLSILNVVRYWLLITGCIRTRFIWFKYRKWKILAGNRLFRMHLSFHTIYEWCKTFCSRECQSIGLKSCIILMQTFEEAKERQRGEGCNVIDTYFVSASLRVFSGALWTVLKLFRIVTSLLYWTSVSWSGFLNCYCSWLSKHV